MYETTEAPKKVSFIRRIGSAVICLFIGSAITFAATNYYWSTENDKQYKVGKMTGNIEGRQELLDEQRAAVRQALGGKIVSAVPN